MSFRNSLNIVTFAMVAFLLWALRDDLMKSWEMLSKVNIWLLLLIIPFQFLSYYASGAAIFSFLKDRGQLETVHWWEKATMALELNFVNHILPTAGVSGVSYMTWRLAKLGIKSGRGTLAQVVRLAASFSSYVVLLMIAVVVVTLDSGVNRVLILTTSGLISFILIAGLVVWFVIDSEKRLQRFSRMVARLVNSFGRAFMRKKTHLLAVETVKDFLDELQDDYRALKHQPRLLVRPFLWGVVFNLTEISLFFFTFLALGAFVNPATILIAVGVAAFVGAFMITPGGTGGYEAMMVLVLATAGVAGATALAGVLLARVILILLTILSGYIFYHHALKKYDKHPA